MSEQDIRSYNFFSALAAQAYVDAIYLYGSRARGDNDSRSDIDLAILCPSATPKDWLDILDIIDEADTLLKIDCVRFDEITDQQFIANINCDKVILYHKHAQARALNT